MPFLGLRKPPAVPVVLTANSVLDLIIQVCLAIFDEYTLDITIVTTKI